MTIPRGTIWESMQSEALDAISEGISPDLSRALNFYQWREKGGFHVTGTSKKDFFISCSDIQYGEVLAKEVGMLMDQAFEHRVMLDTAFSSAKRVPSSSWLLVTAYYWCVYLCLAWLRLVGKVITYLPHDETKRLSALHGKGDKAPSNGTFIILSEGTYGSRRNLKCRRLNANNFHEGLWSSFENDIKARLDNARDDPASMETRLFSLLQLSTFPDGSSWPSKLRNIVNYRVGFGYGAVSGRDFPDLLTPAIRVQTFSTSEMIADAERLATTIAAVGVKGKPEQYGDFLLVFGCLISNILDEHFKYIWDTRMLDHAKWQSTRTKYLKALGIAQPRIWPN
jgi:hypothetical protein